jgi:replicative DNA helicase
MMMAYKSRIIIENSSKIVGELSNDFLKADEIFEKVIGMKMPMTAGKEEMSYKDIVLEKIAKKLKGEPFTSYVESFLPETNELLAGGWEQNRFIIIAARPAMGKTLYAVNEICHFREQFRGTKKVVVFFNLEMSSEQIKNRIMARDLGIETNRIKNADYASSEILKVEKYLDKVDDNLFVICDSSVTPASMNYELNRIKSMGYEIGAIVVDYIQLMSSGSSHANRENEISSISRELKKFTGKYKCPVFGLSQLSRAVETRGGTKYPMLSDLRESGSLEQDADIVQFLYRPEYYGINEDENGDSTDGVIEIITAKNRDGAIGKVKGAIKSFGKMKIEPFVAVNRPNIDHNIPVNEFNSYLAKKEAEVEKVESSKKPVSNVIKRASLFDFDSGDGDGMDNLEF